MGVTLEASRARVHPSNGTVSDPSTCVVFLPFLVHGNHARWTDPLQRSHAMHQHHSTMEKKLLALKAASSDHKPGGRSVSEPGEKESDWDGSDGCERDNWKRVVQSIPWTFVRRSHGTSTNMLRNGNQCLFPHPMEPRNGRRDTRGWEEDMDGMSGEETLAKTSNTTSIHVIACKCHVDQNQLYLLQKAWNFRRTYQHP